MNVSNQQTELFDNTYSKVFQFVCLTEILLNDVCFDHKLFPDCLNNFRSDTVSGTECSAVVLTAVSSGVAAYKRS